MSSVPLLGRRQTEAAGPLALAEPGPPSRQRLQPASGALLLAAAAAAALLADHLASLAAITALLLGVVLRAPSPRRRVYLWGALTSSLGVLVLSPLLATVGWHSLWSGPTVPVLGTIDVTREELAGSLMSAFRLAAVSLAFAAYALLLDHDRLLAGVRFARRSAFAAVLATRLVPTLERDARGLAEAVRGRGVHVEGLRGRTRLVSPLVSGSLERAVSLAEAMEARGFGRTKRTRAPSPARSTLDRAAVALSVVLVLAGVLWL